MLLGGEVKSTRLHGAAGSLVAHSNGMFSSTRRCNSASTKVHSKVVRSHVMPMEPRPTIATLRGGRLAKLRCKFTPAGRASRAGARSARISSATSPAQRRSSVEKNSLVTWYHLGVPTRTDELVVTKVCPGSASTNRLSQ